MFHRLGFVALRASITYSYTQGSRVLLTGALHARRLGLQSFFTTGISLRPASYAS